MAALGFNKANVISTAACKSHSALGHQLTLQFLKSLHWSLISFSEKDGAEWKNNLEDPSYSKCLLFEVLGIDWVGFLLTGGIPARSFKEKGLFCAVMGSFPPVLS